MRLIIQRVSSAKVETDRAIVGEINIGIFVLVGIKKGDSHEMATELAKKVLKLRIMKDKDDKMNKSVLDSGAAILAVSQFTLYANTSDGNRPSFIDAEEPGKAREIYEHFVSKLKESNLNIQTGSFGEYMRINTELDGPVTVILEKENEKTL